VLEQRSEIFQLTENSHDAVLHPHDAGGISYALRAVIATRISAIHEDELQSHYLKLLEDSDEPLDMVGIFCDPHILPNAETNGWLRTIINHVDLLTHSPQMATKASIDELKTAGVAEADIVRITQLVGFVNYQVRLIQGIRLLVNKNNKENK
tara:strand:+ start:1893 stop:2348 length:456 start_codon:yes stop_codon:yes gene_type:complete